jgi:cytochrome oxidase Cu insertion factor (SCO1/SenC/PrrC family)
MRQHGRMRARAILDVGLVVLLAVLLVAGSARPARADGDPASDVLLTQRMFVPVDVTAPAAQQAALSRLLAVAGQTRFPVRVAVIDSAYDLGSVTVLWGKPQTYAQFLGIELSLVHRSPLLVVMPDGLGFAWPGHATAWAAAPLAGVRIATGGAGLLSAAADAVQRLAGVQRVALTGSAPAAGAAGAGSTAAPDTTATTATTAAAATHSAGASRGPAARARAGTGGANAGAIVAALAAALAVALIALVLIRRRGRPIRLVPAAAGVGVLCGAAGAAAFLAIASPAATGTARRATPEMTAAEAAATIAGTPFTWGAGGRPAPDFTLLDQRGRPVSPAAFRGHPVIVTFIDPLCRNLCPLAAQVLDQVDCALPPARRPVILAVSVDIYADSRSDLRQDFTRWRLVPQWRWAVGRPQQLASVWRRYQVNVSVATKHIAGTTVHFITHDEAAYLIDPSGHERALYFWPYSPQDVEREIEHVTSS